MKLGFVAKHGGVWPVVSLCEALTVSRSGVYAWITRPKSRWAQLDEAISSHVYRSFVGVYLERDSLYNLKRSYFEYFDNLT